MHERTSRTGVIAVVGRLWSDRWQAEANLLSRLAEGREVVWMEPAHHWRTPGRLWKSTPVFRRPPEAEHLRVYSPPAWLPSIHRPAALRNFLLAKRLRAIRRDLLARGCDRIVLYIWRPRFAEALNLVKHDAAIYHIVDEYSFSGDDPPTTPREERLLRGVDGVIVHSPALLDKKGALNPNTTLIPNGVNFDRFAEPGAEPGDLVDIRRPRIGYCGYVKRQLDWTLIKALIDGRPEYSWIFVGQVSPHPELRPVVTELETRPNVHFLGEKSSRELARYPQHFDVGIMPYTVDGYTKYISPLKLHEYLAAGKPVVGSSIRTLRDFAHIIGLADGVEEWSRALEKALQPDENLASAREARQTVARAYDWATLTDRVSDVLERCLEGSPGDQ